MHVGNDANKFLAASAQRRRLRWGIAEAGTALSADPPVTASCLRKTRRQRLARTLKWSPADGAARRVPRHPSSRFGATVCPKTPAPGWSRPVEAARERVWRSGGDTVSTPDANWSQRLSSRRLRALKAGPPTGPNPPIAHEVEPAGNREQHPFIDVQSPLLPKLREPPSVTNSQFSFRRGRRRENLNRRTLTWCK